MEFIFDQHTPLRLIPCTRSETLRVLVKFLLLLFETLNCWSDGIEIPLYGGHVRGSVVQVTGDNLGSDNLFGLVRLSVRGTVAGFV